MSEGRKKKRVYKIQHSSFKCSIYRKKERRWSAFIAVGRKKLYNISPCRERERKKERKKERNKETTPS
jgi:hypothetical protein